MSTRAAEDQNGRLPRGVRWRDLPDHLVVVDCAGCIAVLQVGFDGQEEGPRPRKDVLPPIEARVNGFAYCRGCFKSLLRRASLMGWSLECAERSARGTRGRGRGRGVA